MTRRTLPLDGPLDLLLTLRPLRHGGGDPTIRLARRDACRATTTPEGPAAAWFAVRPPVVEVEAWGPGAAWLLDHAPDVLGLHDDRSAFDPTDPIVRSLNRRLQGLRVGRSGAVVESIVPAILEQKVTSEEAHRSYRRLVWAHGEPAPGPLGLPPHRLRLPPSPGLLASLPYHSFHRFGIERRRADTIRRACSYAHRLEEAAALTGDAARRRLLALPGVGPWTAAVVAGAAFGDPDAVIVGDLHLPSLVSWTLAGEPHADDARMLELLEPYAGNRARVVRLVVAGGERPPARYPRRRMRSIASI
ncbi:MAG TPA: DNA-3-methyladenine glycosylase 2 family protein [Actinomycetota bacterium]|nr:DNA-3-methyladenine glycosylase 2 family protein [Actinomycetota bacterium]